MPRVDSSLRLGLHRMAEALVNELVMMNLLLDGQYQLKTFRNASY